MDPKATAMKNVLKNPIFVALDVDTGADALKLIDQVHPYVGGYKLGPRLVLREGPRFVQQVSQAGLVFLDFKFHDIPSTVLSSVQSAFEMGASFVTVHATNGPETLAQLALLEKQLTKQRPFRVLCVTVLTSLSDKNLPSAFQKQTVSDLVVQMAEDVRQSGLNGLVCSPMELVALQLKFPEFFFVTPGIRRAEDAKNEQERVMGPQEALQSGASMLVIGRPIISSPQPKEAAKSIFESIKKP